MMGHHVVNEGNVTISEGQTVLESYFLRGGREQIEESLDSGDYVEPVDQL
jgi:hypothetical protein